MVTQKRIADKKKMSDTLQTRTIGRVERARRLTSELLDTIKDYTGHPTQSNLKLHSSVVRLIEADGRSTNDMNIMLTPFFTSDSKNKIMEALLDRFDKTVIAVGYEKGARLDFISFFKNKTMSDQDEQGINSILYSAFYIASWGFKPSDVLRFRKVTYPFLVNAMLPGIETAIKTSFREVTKGKILSRKRHLESIQYYMDTVFPWKHLSEATYLPAVLSGRLRAKHISTDDNLVHKGEDELKVLFGYKKQSNITEDADAIPGSPSGNAVQDYNLLCADDVNMDPNALRSIILHLSDRGTDEEKLVDQLLMMKPADLCKLLSSMVTGMGKLNAIQQYDDYGCANLRNAQGEGIELLSLPSRFQFLTAGNDHWWRTIQLPIELKDSDDQNICMTKEVPLTNFSEYSRALGHKTSNMSIKSRYAAQIGQIVLGAPVFHKKDSTGIRASPYYDLNQVLKFLEIALDRTKNKEDSDSQSLVPLIDIGILQIKKKLGLLSGIKNLLTKGADRLIPNYNIQAWVGVAFWALYMREIQQAYTHWERDVGLASYEQEQGLERTLEMKPVYKRTYALPTQTVYGYGGQFRRARSASSSPSSTRRRKSPSHKTNRRSPPSRRSPSKQLSSRRLSTARKRMVRSRSSRH